jgi:hypothetical protein
MEFDTYIMTSMDIPVMGIRVKFVVITSQFQMALTESWPPSALNPKTSGRVKNKEDTLPNAISVTYVYEMPRKCEERLWTPFRPPVHGQFGTP